MLCAACTDRAQVEGGHLLCARQEGDHSPSYSAEYFINAFQTCTRLGNPCRYFLWCSNPAITLPLPRHHLPLPCNHLPIAPPSLAITLQSPCHCPAITTSVLPSLLASCHHARCTGIQAARQAVAKSGLQAEITDTSYRILLQQSRLCTPDGAAVRHLPIWHCSATLASPSHFLHL